MLLYPFLFALSMGFAAAVHISMFLSAYSYRKNCEACMLPFLEHINQLLWGFPVLILLSSAHLYFTAKLKFPQKLTLKAIRLSVTPEKGGKGANLSGFAALATTLAATLGTGNIIGVSTAIAIGGPVSYTHLTLPTKRIV